MVDSDIRVIDKVNYVTDIKSKLELERYLFMNVVPRRGIFGEILAKLGIDTDKRVYLKRKRDKDFDIGIIFYYSYDNDNFNEDNMIKLGCNYSRTIELIRNGQSSEYNIRINNNKDIYLESEYFENKREINGISYYYNIYNGELVISISNNFGEEIDFSCDRIRDQYEMILKLENNIKLLEYISNIDFNDSIFDIFNNICTYTDILKVRWGRNLSIKYLKYENVISSCFIKKDNIIVNLLDENKNEKVYKLVRRESNKDVTYLINLSENNNNVLKLDIINNDVNFKIKNELELRKYLLNLGCYLKIEEILKNISDISIGNIMEYEYLFLGICDDNCGWLDKIELSNGDLKCFKITRDNKVFEFNKDGKFHYEVDDETYNYSVDMNGDNIIRCCQYCENGIDNGDDCNRIMYRAIKEAKEEKVRTRKIVDEIIKY